MVQVRAATIVPLARALPSFEDLREQIITAAVDRTCLIAPWPVNQTSFVERKEDARGRISLIAQEIARLVTTIVEQAAAVTRKLHALKPSLRVLEDIDQQLSQLFETNFIVLTPARQLSQYPRYLKAIEVRIDKLKGDPSRDTARMAEIAALHVPWQRTVVARKGVVDPRLEEFRWLLEELRVSLFAQELKTPMPVSVKRLQKVWESGRR